MSISYLVGLRAKKVISGIKFATNCSPRVLGDVVLTDDHADHAVEDVQDPAKSPREEICLLEEG